MNKREPAAKRLKTEARRLDGMQRELFSLLGENTPPVLVPHEKFKDKPKWQDKVTPWTWAPFTNQAREDGLVLHHWVRGQPDADAPYRFVQYNTKIDVPELKADDLEGMPASDGWTVEETLYLFELCREYDLRWLVIHDRYGFTGAGRSVEDLKARFYEVSSALLKKRHNPLSPADEELLEQMKFSKEAEQRRKTHLERLLSRSPAEVAEEEALLLEARRLEALADWMLQERQNLLRLLETPRQTGSAAEYQSSQGVARLHQQLLNEKSRRDKDSTGPTPTRRAHGDNRNLGIQAQIMQKRLTPREEAAYGIEYHDKLTPGIHLRSTKLTVLKPSLAAKATAVLNELGIPPRPTMPTARVCKKFEVLLKAVTTLLDAKRVHDKLETEIRVLRDVSSMP